jgi:hypothetical protein
MWRIRLKGPTVVTEYQAHCLQKCLPYFYPQAKTDPVFKTLWCKRTEQWTRLNTCEACCNLFLVLPFLIK